MFRNIRNIFIRGVCNCSNTFSSSYTSWSRVNSRPIITRSRFARSHERVHVSQNENKWRATVRVIVSWSNYSRNHLDWLIRPAKAKSRVDCKHRLSVVKRRCHKPSIDDRLPTARRKVAVNSRQFHGGTGPFDRLSKLCIASGSTRRTGIRNRLSAEPAAALVQWDIAHVSVKVALLIDVK